MSLLVHYRGKLNADRGSCYYVSVESSIVRDLVQQHAGVLYQYLRIYGMLLISIIEARDLDRQEVSDMDVPRYVIDDIRDRTQRFCDVLNTTRSTSGQRTSTALESLGGEYPLEDVRRPNGFSTTWSSETSDK